MTIESRWSTPIPNCSLQKWVFGSSFEPLLDTPQFVDADRPETHFLTQSDYRLWSKRLALGLMRAGLKPDDRVLLFSGNSFFTPVVFMGVLMAGGVFTGANPSFVARELAYQVKDSGASFLIASETSIEIAVEAAAQVGLPRSRVYSFDATALDPELGKARLGIQHWTTLLASPEDASKFDWIEPTKSSEKICALNYSSGTTGVPKGVEITHYSYVANGVQVNFMERLDSLYEEKKKRARRLGFLPLYHAYGQTYFISIYPREGVPVYIMSSFNFEKMLQHIQKFRIDILIAVPPILVALAKSPLSRKYDLSSVEIIGSGAAPLGSELSDEVVKLWPPGAVKLRQGWGMTELTCSCTSFHPEDKNRSAAVGELVPNCKGRIMKIDGSGEITKAKEAGEVWISGPTLLKGYWNKPEATADSVHVDPDGTRWMKTGDVGYIDKYEPGGLLYIVDRIKELIKVKANQVAPAELEGVLLDNKGISDVAVVGVTINGEEAPRAYVVANPDVKQTEQEIAKWMESRVVKYKWLRGGVKFVDSIPKNPSGKILRKILRDQAAKEVGDRKPSSTKLA
ncbi:acetyl-CoA synthetase-like protein [Annulohypoxylon maeteangense]|uniref:acetyl-CoA synthetase-like protein n=1 Tax=Annulohypoxylon maeteangense TaxID=1927788 RepID=UPI002007DED7|nr:acetyl-CoA synthetase-like protein [Annulohypoxylon maeteangense]KAI0885817.1 acetyl-CoA synthetase-like protein [Annulohypoxylon maeteangense]